MTTIIMKDRNEANQFYNKLLNDDNVVNLLFKVTKTGIVFKYEVK